MESKKINIETAIKNEIIGNGYREMKQRFKKLTVQFKAEYNNTATTAAFGKRAKVAHTPLPINEETLRAFLKEDENNEENASSNKTEQKKSPVKKKNKH
jgi:hypothetical protein